MSGNDVGVETFAPAGFFVMRTPLLPFDEMAAWGDGIPAPGSVDDEAERNRAALRDRLFAAVDRPELRDALFVGSPSVADSLDVWRKEPDSERGRRVESALVAYFSRAAARATPFGLFAGCTTGTVSSETRLRLQARERYRRYSRIDMDYLWALAEAVERDPKVRDAFMYQPNSSLYEVAGRLHLTEGRVGDNGRSYHLVAVDKTPELAAVLERARGGATLRALAEVLIDDEISQEEAEAYVAELADGQLLVADVRPRVTGEDPMDDLIAALAGHPSTTAVGERLQEARAVLKFIDAEVGTSPDHYRGVAGLLSGLPAEPNLSRLIQVDMVKPAEQATLDARVVAEIAAGARLLHRLQRPETGGAFARFGQEFSARYETREVPLVEALDEEIGIGFGRSDSPLAEASPLLAGVPFRAGDGDGEPWTARDAVLLRKLGYALAQGRDEISLERADIEALSADERLPLPDAFHVMVTLAAASESAVAGGDFRVLLHGVGGPSGARMLGRFCHADPSLLDFVREHLRAEEARRPEALFAEIVHLPEGRVGNILFRPLLRAYEIPFLGRSGAAPAAQIPVTDLLVCVRDGRVVLRSRRLGREIVPRLTTAHNYGWRSLGLYRFLCALQHQDVLGGVSWDWGALETAPFLPRVVSGRLVLSRACWNLDETELRALTQAASGSAADLRDWRGRLRLPRYVALVDDDNELVVDLDNALSVTALGHQLRGRRRATLVEMYPRPDELCATGPEGRFVHELVVPFVKTTPSAPQAQPATIGAVRRRFPPGSEWLYVKLYTGMGTADQVLNHLIDPLVRSSLRTGAADSWFFLRYGDPDWHLRLRLHGEPERLHTDVLPRLQSAAGALLDDGRLWRIQLDTYEREVERYGGARGIELAESVFAADSEAVLRIISALSGDVGLDLRWRLALLGMDRLFDDLGLSLEEKRASVRQSRLAFGREFRVDGAFRNQVGKRYRTERASLESLLRADPDPAGPLAEGVRALQDRSLRLAPVTRELRRLAEDGQLAEPIDDLAKSFAHMHVNRLLRSAQRAQELVLYELLDRVYSSRSARADAP
jgi:thiopeptide-type bacteriocin biosynthesis protein